MKVTVIPLNETSVVSFNGDPKPKNGWCVILAGGPASGKTYTINKRGALLIDGKHIDLDKWSKTYAKMHPEDNWDIENPDHIRSLHQIVKGKGWREQIMDIFYNTNPQKDNIIIDIMGAYRRQLNEYAEEAKEHGYKTALIWIVTNVNVALERNKDKKDRKREMDEYDLKKLHRRVLYNLLYNDGNQYIEKSAGRRFDEIWLVISSGPTNNLTPEEQNLIDEMGAIRLEKQGDKFVFPPELKDFIFTLTHRYTSNNDSLSFLTNLKKERIKNSYRQSRTNKENK